VYKRQLIHILTYELNDPPVLIEEGLAVYLSEKLGNNSLLTLIGYPDSTTDEVLQHLLSKEKLLPLEDILKLRKISDSENVKLAYLQSASFIKFLIERFGKNKLLEWVSESSKNDYEKNIHLIKSIFQENLSLLETEWLDALKKKN
jgi:hypothetical protein